MDYFKRVAAHTPTRFWINNVTRNQASMAIDAGAVCCTQNPAYLSKVVGHGDDSQYLDGIIDTLIQTEQDDNAVVAELQRKAIAGICEKFHPIYENSGGKLGLVSIQADPFAENVETILDNAEKSLALAENFIIKIPATQEGIAAMSVLVKRSVAVLATEVMSMDQLIDVCEMHRKAASSMKNPAPFWIAHINGIFDEHLSEYVLKSGVAIAPDVLRQASLLLGRKMVGTIRDRNYDVHYLAGGARNVNHFTDWVGVNGGVTINWKGTADTLIAQDLPVIDVFNAPTSYPALDELLARVPEFKTAWTPASLDQTQYEQFGPVVRFRNSFEEGWTAARAYVTARRAQIIVR